MVNTCVVPGCSSPQIEINSSLSTASLSLTSPYSGNGSTLLEERICQSTPTAECAASTSETPIEESSDLVKVLQKVSPSWLQQLGVLTPRRPLERHVPSVQENLQPDGVEASSSAVQVHTRDVGVNTDGDELGRLTHRVLELEREVDELKASKKVAFRLESIAGDDTKVAFYTGFTSYARLKACYDFLGPAATKLQHCTRDSSTATEKSKKIGRQRSLSPLEKFFLTMVRLRLGLLEQDIAYRFGISQSTVSQIFTTWINFMYLQSKRIPLWPPKEYVRSHMPQVFKMQYPTTRVIVDNTDDVMTIKYLVHVHSHRG